MPTKEELLARGRQIQSNAVAAQSTSSSSRSVPGVPRGSGVFRGSSIAQSQQAPSAPVSVIPQPITQNLAGFTQSQYERQSALRSASSESYAAARNINLTANYRAPPPFEGLPWINISGEQAKISAEKRGQRYQSEANRMQQDINSISGFAPTTQFITTPSGKISIKFPYAGADRYVEYKKLLDENPALATTLGWGWGGLGNVDMAYYRLTGQEEKITQRHIEQLASYQSAKDSLASGKYLDFGKQFTLGWFSSPATQIGVAYGAGELFGAAGSYVGGAALVASRPAVILGGKIAMSGIGSTMIGVQGYNIAKTAYEGDIGKALGESWLLGTSVATGIAGYKHGSSYITKTGLTWGERGGLRGAKISAKNFAAANIKFGGATTINLEGTTIKNPTLQDINNLFYQRTTAIDFGITGKNLPSWRYTSFSPESAALYKGYAVEYYGNLASLRGVSSLSFQKFLIGSQGGWRNTFSNILGSKIKGSKVFDYITNARSGILRRNKPEIMGGTSSKLYPAGTGKDIDFNTAANRYIIDMVQIEKYHSDLLSKLDVKPAFKTGDIIATTSYRQPTPYTIYDMYVAPLIKTAATSGEVGFGLPAAEGIKGLSTAANMFTRLSFIKTGKIPGTTSSVGRFTSIAASLEENPFIQSSARITSLFEHQTIGQKLLPYVLKLYNKLPSNMQSSFYKFNIGKFPSNIGIMFKPVSFFSTKTISSLFGGSSNIKPKPISS